MFKLTQFLSTSKIPGVWSAIFLALACGASLSAQPVRPVPALPAAARAIPDFHPLVIEKGVQREDLSSYVYILEDPEGELTYEEISAPARRGDFIKPEKLNFGRTESVIWVRLDFENKSGAPLKLLLELDHPVLDHVDYYRPLPGGKFDVEYSGDGVPYHDRRIKRRTYVFALNLAVGEKSSRYIRVDTESTLTLPLQVWSQRDFADKHANEQFAFGLFYGLFFVMAIYNLFLFLFLKDASYLLYALYIFAFGILQMSINGLAYQYLWPSVPYLASYAPQFMIPAVAVLSLGFTRYFLITRENSPRGHNVFNILIGIGIVLALASTVAPIKMVLGVNLVHALVSILAVIFVGFRTLARGYRPARYYLSAWGALILGTILYLLKTFGVVPTMFLTTYAMQIGAALEVVLLSLALAYRIQELRREKESAQEELLRSRMVMLDSFARFVPREFLTYLGKESIVDIDLGESVQKEVTVFFNDIRNFTGLSESMSTEDNFRFLNSYLKRMGPLITDNEGFVDKFIGDAIMALFPERPEDGVNASVNMMSMLYEYNMFRIESGFRPIAIGIGMHTGESMLGTVGSTSRLDTTVIGDTVNTAARLESLTKKFGVPIIVSGTTRERMKDPKQFHMRNIGMVRVKGKSRSVEIFEVFDADTEKSIAGKEETRAKFEEGIMLFREHSYGPARQLFQECLARIPDDQVADIYAQKCASIMSTVRNDMDVL